MKRTMTMVVATALILALTAGIAWAKNIDCPTAGGDEGPYGLGKLCEGTKKSDNMEGTSGKDEMFGLKGADIMRGKGGDDYIDGGACTTKDNGFDCPESRGDNKLYGGAGVDLIFGSKGDDKVFGGDGDDELYGYLGKDTVRGEDGDDEIDAHYGNPDKVFGGPGDDTISTSDGAKDVVDCGGDEDEVVSFDEGLDVISNNCEITDGNVQATAASAEAPPAPWER